VTVLVLLCALGVTPPLCETHRHAVEACPLYLTPAVTRPGWRVTRWECRTDAAAAARP
jgi:hypothetical protein